MGGVATVFLCDRLFFCGLIHLIIVGFGLAIAPAAHLIGLRALAAILTLDCRLGDLVGDQPNAANSIVVGGDHVIDHIRIAIGIDHSHDRNADFAGLFDSQLLFMRVDN